MPFGGPVMSSVRRAVSWWEQYNQKSDLLWTASAINSKDEENPSWHGNGQSLNLYNLLATPIVSTRLRFLS